MTKVGTPKRRKPWLAALLSLVNTGWGQFYVGNWKRGLILLGIDLVLGLALVFVLMGSFISFILGLAALIVFNLYVAVDAYLSARRAREYVLRPCNRWWVYALLIGLNVVISQVMDEKPYEAYTIPSGSMEATLQVDDYLMARELSPDDPIERGDILIFLYPEDRTKHFVKRTIGLPGETVEIRNKVVYINGDPLDEPYARHGDPNYVPMRDDFGPALIPAGSYFMMGDNRESSHDSRFIGPIIKGDIVARALYLYMPLSGDWSRAGMSLR